MGGRKSTVQQIATFRADAKLLKIKYKLDKMAQLMGQKNSSYLSRCINGSRDPGQDLLDTFYIVFASDLIELKKHKAMPGQGSNNFSHSDPSSATAEEPPQDYNQADVRDDHIKTLKLNNEDLRRNLGIMMKSNEILVNSNSELVKKIELFSFFKPAAAGSSSSAAEGHVPGEDPANGDKK